MDPYRKPFVDRLFRNVQMAHIKGVIGMRHASTLEHMLENYQQAFQNYEASPRAASRQECTRRFIRAEFPFVESILAECYDPDREKMIGILEARLDLLDRMPQIMDLAGVGERHSGTGGG